MTTVSVHTVAADVRRHGFAIWPDFLPPQQCPVWTRSSSFVNALDVIRWSHNADEVVVESCRAAAAGRVLPQGRVVKVRTGLSSIHGFGVSRVMLVGRRGGW